MRGAQVIRFLLIVLVAAAAAPLNAQEAPVEFEPTLESLARLTSAPSGFAMRSLASTSIGACTRSPSMASGTLARCTRRAAPCTAIMWRRGGIPRSLGTRTSFRCGRRRSSTRTRGSRCSRRRREYFTPCAIHHDGFFLGRTRYSPFNAVEMGPKKDLLGMMREATLRHGLRWGVTTHYDRTLSWIQPAHGADREGPLAGVPYDGADPKYQDLYLHKYYDGNRAGHRESPDLVARILPAAAPRDHRRVSARLLLPRYPPCPSPARTTAARGCGCSPISTTPT